MSYGLDDNGLTLRLFINEKDALSHPCAQSPTQYGCGWIARDDAGRWIDAHGVLPTAWRPQRRLLAACKPAISAPVT